jgi:hypothetical protein
MSQHDAILTCRGPADAHALDDIPVRPREGNLDAICPTCQGRGQWNRSIYGQGRVVREGCDHCMGLGWLETGEDAIPIPDIVLGPGGHPRWITRMVPPLVQTRPNQGSLLD